MIAKLLTWFLIFNKRLFKKASFIFLLLSVILISVFMKFSSTLDSGIVSVAILKTNPADKIDFENKNILHFVQVDSMEEGKNLLKQDKVQAIWIFDDVKKTILEGASLESIQPIVTIIEKQDTVFMKFARELLFSKLFPQFSYEAFKYYIRNVIQINEENLSNQNLDEYYSRYLKSEPLIKIQTVENSSQETNYLLSPFRGLLALWILICSFAACLYFMQDLNNGIFTWINKKHHFFVMLGMNFIVVFDCCVLFLLCAILTGIFTNPFSEIVNLLLYSVSSILFSTFFMLILNKIERFSCVIAPIVILSLVFTPVFVSLPMLKKISQLLPGFYYLNGMYNSDYSVKMIFYILVLFVIDFVIWKIFRQYPTQSK